ncbi:MAG: hypothetical protein ACKOA9_01265 [Actinomycetota bacterium]
MAPPIRAVWAVPRSVSTAFERMVAERGDLEVLSEPFSVAYYDGPEARSSRYPCTAPEATFAAVRRRVLEAGTTAAVFCKDMAYHVLPALDDALMRACHHTVLIRDPAWSLPSLAAQWPDFTTDEAGFAAAHALHDRLREAGCDVVVLDAADLCRDPEEMVAQWCARAGLPVRPESLRWSSGMRPEWTRWQEWHATTAASTGFLAAPEPPPVSSDRRMRDAITAARAHYGALAAHALRPKERCAP